MRVAAVIAEYNPFHSGHRYHLERTRASGATHIVAVMSGSFVQRGEPAFFDKWTRARAALLCGADLAVELPLPFAAAGAQRFARAGVAIARALGAHMLSFGSECGDVELLREAARAAQSPQTGEAIRALLKSGMPFAEARTLAVRLTAGDGAARVLLTPNNALAVEYICAVRELYGRDAPELVSPLRAGDRHDGPLGASGGYASASALRAMAAAEGPEALAGRVPRRAMEAYRGAPVCLPGAWELPMLARLRAMEPEAFSALPDLSEGIERRLFHAARRARTLEELYSLAKTRRYTRARLQRLALAAYLGLTEDLAGGAPPYVRVLGCTTRGREALGAARPEGAAALPVGGSLKKLEGLGPRAARYARLEAAAGDQYALLLTPRGECGMEYRAGVVRAD